MTTRDRQLTNERCKEQAQIGKKQQMCWGTI